MNVSIERMTVASVIEQHFAESCEFVVEVPKSAMANALHLFDHIQDIAVVEVP